MNALINKITPSSWQRLGALLLLLCLYGAGTRAAPAAPTFTLDYEALSDALAATLSTRPTNPEALQRDCTVARAGKCSAQRTLLSPLPLGHWLDVNLEVHWSPTPASWGRVSVSVAGNEPGTNVGTNIGNNVGEDQAGREIVYSGPTTWDERPNAAYLKWGLYKPGSTDGTFTFPPRRVWHDEVVVERIDPP